MFRPLGRLLLALLIALPIAVVAQPSLAAAAPPDRLFRGTGSNTFQEVLCGVPVTTTEWFTGAFSVFFDRAGNLRRVQGSGTYRATYTNAAGESITFFAASHFTETPAIDANGILTVDFVDTGLAERITDAAGNVLTTDVGNLVQRLTVDLGDLEDPDDDVVLGFAIVFEAGRHPEGESGFALFCQIVQEQLG